MHPGDSKTEVSGSWPQSPSAKGNGISRSVEVEKSNLEGHRSIIALACVSKLKQFKPPN